MGDIWASGKAVEINAEGVRIEKSTISNSEATGIYNNASSLTITDSNIFGNLTGIYNNNGKPTLQDNKIYSNVNFGINNNGKETIDARNTYWGTPTGPLHPTLNPNGKGNKVSDRVLFSPWIEQITQVDQTITFTEIPNKYVDDTLTLTATATSALPVSFSIVTQPVSGVALLSGNTITFLGTVGQVTVTASQPGNQFFKSAQLQRTFTVSKRNQSITFNAISAKSLEDAPFSLKAIATSGLAVSFSVVSGPATLNGNTLTLTAVGTVVVEARQTGDKVYNPAPSVRQSFVVVESLKKPDLQISQVKLVSDKVQAGDDVNYQVSIKNTGGTTAPSGTLLRGYLSSDNVIDESDILFSIDTLSDALPADQTKILTKSVKAPSKLGSFNLLFWVNPNATLGELLFTNNISAPVRITIEPSYTATASVGPTYFLQGSNIPVIGSATKSNGSAVANVPVEVYIITKGIRRTVLDTTDASGKFSTSFVPLSTESGHYIVGAAFPGLNQTTEQDKFDILGVRINKGNNILFTVTQNQTLSGSLPVENLSGKSLTNFTLAPITLPIGATVEFSVLPNLAGNASATIGYSIKGSVLTNGNNCEEISFQAKSEEGVIQKINTYYYCRAANADIIADISHIQANVSQSVGERRIEVKLINRGQAATGAITINLPDVKWLTSVTPKTLPSLVPGDTTVAVFNFLALTEVPVNNLIKGTIGINAANGNSLSIPFTFQKVSQATGTARIVVTNQYTYNTNNGNGPKVKDAVVKITNYFTGEVYVNGKTSEDGVFTKADLPEGKHRITVEKEKHLPYEAIIEINPGAITESTVFLNYQAITFSWNVVPTTVQDEYETVLEAKFETNVPMPVVTIEMPKTMPQLSEGQSYQFMVTLTNHGLITALEVALNLPTTDSEYEFITNYTPADLPAKNSIQIPVIMRRRSGVEGGRLSATSANAPCTDFVGALYFYICDSKELGQNTGATFNYTGRSCPGGGFCYGCYPLGGGEAVGGIIPISFKQEKVSCVACISDIAQAVLGCIPIDVLAFELVAEYTGLLICYSGELIEASNTQDLDAFGRGLQKCAIDAAVELNLGLAIKQIPKRIVKKLPIINQIFCIKGVYEAIVSCTGIKGKRDGRMRANELPNAVLKEAADNLLAVINGYEANRNWMAECYGELIDRESWPILFTLVVNPFFTKQEHIPTNIQNDIIELMAGYDISSSELSAFFTRWNTSLDAKSKNILAPNTDYPNIINWNKVKNYVATLIQAHNYAVKKQFKTIDEMYLESIKSLNEIIDGEQKGVCASVTVQFSQQLTMTREAFEGTLEIFNGHPTDAMEKISVDIQIKDENGAPANGLFEIQPQNPASLSDIGAEQKGSLKFLFIPQVNAAPQTSKVYKFGGSVNYWDPYAQAMVTMPLTTVPITVNPSPNLMLHYFMERNILGDDALTSQEVEPSVPAELAVMIENQGYGYARDMTISSAQPKIVENEKGLAIDFNLIGSNLQGKPMQLGLTNINFGTIEPLKTKIGQWYFTSSLLGKFVSYDAKVLHKSSFGNQNLSLVQGVKLHELTKSIRLYGELEDGITDFLVNDVFDVNDRPDIIYFSQGNKTAKVSQASNGSFNIPISGPTYTNKLTVTPSEAGFNYINLPDPGNKLYELVSVTRSDGQVIPLNNVWLTFVTLPVSRSPIYENKFHMVDNFATTAAVTYTIVWKPKDNGPKIDRIEGAPTQVSSTQVKNLKVYFNKRIDPATFTFEDLNLSLQGGFNIINSSVVITRMDSVSFNIDLTAITTGNGLYVFTAQAANVKDMSGASGTGGKQVSWSQFLTEMSIQGLQNSYCSNATSQALVGVPSGGIFTGAGITGNVFDPTKAGVGSHVITYSKDGKSVTASVTVNPTPSVRISSSTNTLTCATPTVELTASGGLNYLFAGPGIVKQGGTDGKAVIDKAGTYSVEVTDANGCIASASIVITENNSTPRTKITVQPDSGSVVAVGASVSISLSATGSNLTYQWTKDGVVVPGASTRVLSLTGVTTSQSGTYVCTVSGDCGNAISQPFILTVKADPILSVQSGNTPFQIELYPNPATSNSVWIKISGAAKQLVHLQLIDLKGRIVWEYYVNVTTMEYIEQLDISNLSMGMLLLKASTTGQIQTRILMKP
ncbi:hypothetical protein FHS57_002253 [Runella defluvii]|uniref:Ig-like domain-containing protein n=1 Tax=Runella defluvii TaxID=370973 RepID=A0A7W5ZJ57_9BACT|nr:T9SS type A sorting domain-containing protein [Runella defluvii]MBB3838248.1 hypothetical protein [Runella defluvii]